MSTVHTAIMRDVDANCSCRPFKIVPKSDGRPAVEVENGGKRQQFVSSVS